ncbi:serine/threonine-protein kinase Sgk3 [Microcaecilia unicolor]|uniref:Serine/threonine-protein kinase Sgk3 n=1 Tax=Microcaecilia unicolor TaxID=1415580 RepID=A0A6P7YV75_9AMPH|nr:serine/threonine-protein kinase Sgk3 [Microcaecilia unicolor]XP_030071065.1 serine/threonine-protein kinase Sgk3 [Microcaecilia unicolor]XP_030071074.1 serine/threonine-protein kinase Sgk3 [Microcaecilia unicolor]XP_030071082.1 serine/threonine-protein kinase Sgk3 [Microcaecilia unicolor]XP_030071090.1 serine/threonine-protein kinase Sgk3 [Microcaecilia unicolor]
MDAKSSCPSVSIPSSDEHREKRKRYTVYKVIVTMGRCEWFVFRRYTEFDKLYNTLRKQFPSTNLKIPAKRIFGDNFDPDFIQQRREGLNDFIQNLLRHPELCNHPDVKAFLQMDRPKQLSDPSEDEDDQSSQKLNSTSQNINLGPSGNPHAKPADFDFLKVIGKGSFGKVLLAKRKLDGKYYAVKVLQKKIVLNKKEQKHIMAERNVLLKNVKHPFLVGLHYSFQTTEKLYFVLDFVNGGELFFHLQRERTFPEYRAQFYAAEIASALGYLHSIKIVYRDLKPENILLDSQGHVVLTDFGLCKEGIASSDTTSTFCGTPEYLAPEVIKKQPYDNTVDWWCLGAVLYEMLHGLPPFYNRDTAEMYENILHKPLALKPGVSLTAWSILEELLEKDRQQRLGAKEDFHEIQSHPFFSSINWTDLIQKKIPPPFNPNVVGPDDIRNFDTEFTEEMVPYSVCIATDYSIVNASVLEAEDAFAGFSYAASSEDLFP